MKILLDMNMSPQWVDVLIGKGIPATHWSSVGLSNASDMEIFPAENRKEYRNAITGTCQHYLHLWRGYKIHYQTAHNLFFLRF